MVMTEHGKVQHGGIVFQQPLALPEGTEVVVHIETVAGKEQAERPMSPEDFARLPFFGMWAGRSDMHDSALWVRSEREQWRRHTNRED